CRCIPPHTHLFHCLLLLGDAAKDNSTSSPPPRPPASPPRTPAGSALVGLSASPPPCSPAAAACQISPPRLRIFLAAAARRRPLRRPPRGCGTGRTRPARDGTRCRRGSSARRRRHAARSPRRRRPPPPSRRWGTCRARCGWPCAARGSPTPTCRSCNGCRGSSGASRRRPSPSSCASRSAALHCLLPGHKEVAEAASAGRQRVNHGACPSPGQPCTCTKENKQGKRKKSDKTTLGYQSHGGSHDHVV
ncbi:unnamed protein product, partial [Musa hybrid cultivar]